MLIKDDDLFPLTPVLHLCKKDNILIFSKPDFRIVTSFNVAEYLTVKPPEVIVCEAGLSNFCSQRKLAGKRMHFPLNYHPEICRVYPSLSMQHFVGPTVITLLRWAVVSYCGVDSFFLQWKSFRRRMPGTGKQCSQPPPLPREVIREIVVSWKTFDDGWSFAIERKCEIYCLISW